MAPCRSAWALLPVLALGACDGDSGGGGRAVPDSGSQPPSAGDSAALLPGCAEYCAARRAACGTAESTCLIVCSDVNREKKLRCLPQVEALSLCYASSASTLCDGGIPDGCVDEIGRLSSCYESDGGDTSGCVQTFGGGTCRGDFVDGRTAQKTCYPGVAIPSGCISVSEILALRGFPDEGPPATHPDGTLVDPAVVCCPP